MARTLDPAVHARPARRIRRRRPSLIQTKGYERMSIQDVLDELDASRGAFYHYFDSKAALLEAVIERMGDAAIAGPAPRRSTIRDLAATEKFELVFTAIARWKAERHGSGHGDPRRLAVGRERDRPREVPAQRRARMTPLLADDHRPGRRRGVRWRPVAPRRRPASSCR